MTISVESGLPDVGLVKNEVRLRLSTDNKYSTAGVYAAFDLIFSGGAPLNNETLRLQWTDTDGVAQDFTYTWKTSPSGDLQLALKDIGADMDDYVRDEIMPKLLRNYYFARDYNITYSGSASTADVRLVAKNIGAVGILTITDAATDLGYTSDAPSGTDPVARANFVIAVDVFIENTYASELTERVVQLEGSADLEGDESDFFLERYLKSYLSRNLPAYNASSVSYAIDMCKRFFVFYAEKYGDTPAYYNWTRYPSTGYYKALLGGLAEKNFPGNTFDTLYYTNTAKKFLTNIPRIFTVTPEMQVYLYAFIGVVDKVKVCMYYTDGTSTNANAISATLDTLKIGIIPAGYTQLSIDNLKTAGKTVYKYDLWLCNGTHGINITSEVMTFKVDHNNYQNDRYLLFQNRLGAFDTLFCSGKWTKGMKVSADQALMIPDNSTASSTKIYEGSIVPIIDESREDFTAFTGYKTLLEMEWIQELIESPAIYLIENSAFHRVVLDTQELSLWKDDEYAYGAELKLRYALESIKS